MPGTPRAIVADAERRFPVRIAVKVPPGGFGRRYTAIMDWLDEHCGIDGWSIASAGTRDVDQFGLGPEASCDEAARRRLFGED